MSTTIVLQRTPAPEVVTIDGTAGPFEIVRVTADGTQVDIFLGWDDASAVEQARKWSAAFQDAGDRARRRLDAEWAAALPFEAPDPITAAKAEEDRVAS